MLKTIIALMTTGVLAGAVYAEAPPPAPAPIPDAATLSTAQLLQETGFAQATPAIADATDGQIILAQSFPFPPFGGQCDGYEPPAGCTVTFNNGSWCTMRCQPNTQILQVCGCVR